MLTMFTIPKAFQGNMAILQTNAIRSWTLLRPACEIILFGNDEGTAEIAGELGLRHVPDVECNEFGTPLINNVFKKAHDIASHQLMCFVNTDIILMSDFLPALQLVQEERFLLVGLRWDLELNELVNFEGEQWEPLLRKRLTEHGKPHNYGGGGDYFIYPRGLYDDMPPFAIGRGGWDNWIIYRARSLNIPVIDCTRGITAIHQNHDYSHVRERSRVLWKGPESRENLRLMGDHAFTTEYATAVLTPEGIKPARSMRDIYFRLRALPILYPRLHFLIMLFKAFERVVRTIQSIVTSPD